MIIKISQTSITSFIGSVFNNLKNKEIWKLHGMYLLGVVAMSILAIVLFLVLGFIVFGLTTLIGPGILPGALAAIFTLLISLMFMGAMVFLIGTLYNGTREIIETGKFNLNKIVEKTKPQVMKLFLGIISVYTVILIPVIIIFLILFLAGVIVLPGAGSVAATTTYLMLLLGILVAILVTIVLMIIITPFLAVYYPVLLFEKHGVIDSIKRTIKIAKPSFWFNLSIVILYILFNFLMQMLLQIVFTIPMMIPIVNLIAGVFFFIALLVLLVALAAIWDVMSVLLYKENIK